MTAAQLGQTWVEIEGAVYGAQPDEAGPIGGGEGYTRLVAGGDFTVRTDRELIDALASARPGQTVFVAAGAEIELTERIRSEGFTLRIPPGVTLAGSRGDRGAPGALIYSEEFGTLPMIDVTGSDVRITGLRVRGPDPKRRVAFHRRVFYEPGGGSNEAFYRFPVSIGVRSSNGGLEVDNCELSGWSCGAIDLCGGSGHHVHHCHIHHNQRMGLGYGVCVAGVAARIDFNLFADNKHSIAGTGQPGTAYEACHNVVWPGPDRLRDFAGQSHLFDMHGGRDRLDGTNVAGDAMDVHHNTFVGAESQAVVIRGVPAKQARISANWFYASKPGWDVMGAEGNTEAGENAYGPPAGPVHVHAGGLGPGKEK